MKSLKPKHFLQGALAGIVPLLYSLNPTPANATENSHKEPIQVCSQEEPEKCTTYSYDADAANLEKVLVEKQIDMTQEIKDAYLGLGPLEQQFVQDSFTDNPQGVLAGQEPDMVIRQYTDPQVQNDAIKALTVFLDVIISAEHDTKKVFFNVNDTQNNDQGQTVASNKPEESKSLIDKISADSYSMAGGLRFLSGKKSYQTGPFIAFNFNDISKKDVDAGLVLSAMYGNINKPSSLTEQETVFVERGSYNVDEERFFPFEGDDYFAVMLAAKADFPINDWIDFMLEAGGSIYSSKIKESGKPGTITFVKQEDEDNVQTNVLSPHAARTGKANSNYFLVGISADFAKRFDVENLNLNLEAMAGKINAPGLSEAQYGIGIGVERKF